MTRNLGDNAAVFPTLSDIHCLRPNYFGEVLSLSDDWYSYCVNRLIG